MMSLLAVSAAAVCPEGYVESAASDVCYSPNVGTGLLWTECNEACATQGDMMLCPRDVAENEFIVAAFGVPYPTHDLWIGYSGSEGNFQWVDGCDSNFELWNDGVPTFGYVSILAQISDDTEFPGKWMDYGNDGRSYSEIVTSCYCERPFGAVTDAPTFTTPVPTYDTPAPTYTTPAPVLL